MKPTNENLLKNNLKNKMTITPSQQFDYTFNQKLKSYQETQSNGLFTYLSHFVSSLLVLGVVVLVVNQFNSPDIQATNEDFYMNAYLEFEANIDEEVYQIEPVVLTSSLFDEI